MMLSTNGRQVIAYLCNGNSRSVSVLQWFKGPVTSSGIDITNAHAAHLVTAVSAQVITGTVTLKDGSSVSFTARLIPDPGRMDGLFRSEETFHGVRYLGGWGFVRPNFASARTGAETQVSLTRVMVPMPTCCSPDGRVIGIINEQTGALIVSPPVEYLASVTVPGLGVFRLTRCHAMQRFPGMTPVVNELLYRGIVPRNRTMVVDINEAAHYRRFIELMKVQILSFSVKIDPGFTNVTRAWRLVVDKVRERAAKAGEYPLNLMLEMRPIRSSKVLLSPAFGQDDEHHCYFELISFTGTPSTTEFFHEVALAWMDIRELSARPHWAKYFFDIPGIIPYIREAWGENLTAFATIRDDLDPDRVFMNPALMRIFYDED